MVEPYLNLGLRAPEPSRGMSVLGEGHLQEMRTSVQHPQAHSPAEGLKYVGDPWFCCCYYEIRLPRAALMPGP